MKRVFAIVLTAACTGMASAQAFKCTDSGGKVSFQEHPCAIGEKGQELNIKRPKPLSADEQRIIRATATGSVTRGMTASQVRSSWGSPTKINQSVGSYGTNEQWVYDRGGFVSQYVYLENGVVTSFQSPSK